MPVPDCFHIGYHKTASTYLQAEVFKRLASYHYVRAKPSYDDRNQLIEISNEELMVDPEAASGRKKLLYSHNSLTGDAYHDDVSTVDLVHATNPSAKILISIRSQFAALRSYYFTCSKNGFGGSYETFIHHLADNGKLRYFEMVSAYRDKFGPENVKVLFYEELARDPDRFLCGLLDFLGITNQTAVDFPKLRRRPSPSDLVIDAWSISSRLAAAIGCERNGGLKRAIDQITVGPAFLASRIWSDAFGSPLNYRNYDRHAPTIDRVYGETNRKMFDLLGLSISEYGYPGAR